MGKRITTSWHTVSEILIRLYCSNELKPLIKLHLRSPYLSLITLAHPGRVNKTILKNLGYIRKRFLANPLELTLQLVSLKGNKKCWAKCGLRATSGDFVVVIFCFVFCFCCCLVFLFFILSVYFSFFVFVFISFLFCFVFSLKTPQLISQTVDLFDKCTSKATPKHSKNCYPPSNITHPIWLFCGF